MGEAGDGVVDVDGRLTDYVWRWRGPEVGAGGAPMAEKRNEVGRREEGSIRSKSE